MLGFGKVFTALLEILQHSELEPELNFWLNFSSQLLNILNEIDIDTF